VAFFRKKAAASFKPQAISNTPLRGSLYQPYQQYQPYQPPSLFLPTFFSLVNMSTY